MQNNNNTEEIIGAIEIEQNRLYWISDTKPPKCRTSHAFYFCIDDALVYEPFFEDFGPLNLSMTHKFCSEINKIMNNQEYKNHKIYHYTSTDPKKRANAAYLMGAYMVIVKGKTGDEAWSFFENAYPPFKPFRDSLQGECSYPCTILDCLRGLDYALQLGWYNPSSFKVQEYEYYEKVDNGDMNWIIPGKFLAFSSPSANQYDSDGYRTYTPDDYCPLFKKWKVNVVIRLNKVTYDRERFLKNGVNHYDLFFEDGTCPPDSIIDEFINISEAEPNALAVHCKAGLGRTGSLIACYAMKHYRFPAAAFIGWIRIARPGSILGPQQHWLCSIESTIIKKGEEFRQINRLSDQDCLRFESLKLSDDKVLKMNTQDIQIQKFGQFEQGETLNNKKIHAYRK